MEHAERYQLALRAHAAEHASMREAGLARMSLNRHEQKQLGSAGQMLYSYNPAGLSGWSTMPTWSKWALGAAVIGVPIAILLYLES